MKLNEKAKRLRIYISSTDKYEHSPLYEVIVYSARKQGLTGATVLKGIMGYGASSQIYTSKLWEITDKVPLVVEIIDEPEKVDSFFENIKPLLITVDETSVLMHNPGNKK
jgi:PII-like signaling protein